MINIDFLRQLDRFHLAVKKRVTSQFQGPRKSIAQGRGLQFKEHRMYVPGDDTRQIDWKIFARTDDLYIKTYEEDRNLTVHMILDNSASMGFGKPISKFDYGAMIGVGFGYLAMKNNEKFQFSTFAEQVDVFQARRGMGQLASMVAHLNSRKTTGHSKMYDCMEQYRKTIGSRSVLIVISDFLIPTKEITESLYHLQGQDIKLIQVLDPIEKELRFQGDFNLIDSEEQTKLRTYVSPRMRVKYQQQMDQHNATIGATCDRLGIAFHSITTDTPIFDAFYKVLEGQ